jgi:hypothetical protein
MICRPAEVNPIVEIHIEPTQEVQANPTEEVQAEPTEDGLEGYISNEDDDYEANSNDDSDFAELEDDDWDWIHEIPFETFAQAEVLVNTNATNPEPSVAADFEDNDVDSDDLDTPPGTEDDEEDLVKYPKFKTPESDDKVSFELSMTVNTKAIVREAVKSFAMENTTNLHFTKNDSKRMVVRCDPECPFYEI